MKYSPVLLAAVLAAAPAFAASENIPVPARSPKATVTQTGAEPTVATSGDHLEIAGAISIQDRLAGELEALRAAKLVIDEERFTAVEMALEKGEMDKAAAVLADVRGDEIVRSAIHNLARESYVDGMIAEANGDFHLARDHFLRAARLQPETADHLFKAQSLARLSEDFRWALRYGLDYHDLMSRRHGEQGEDFARAANELALTLARLARHDEAESFYRKARDARERVLAAAPVFTTSENIPVPPKPPAAGSESGASGVTSNTPLEIAGAISIQERLIGEVEALRAANLGIDEKRFAEVEAALARGETDTAAAQLGEIRADVRVSHMIKRQASEAFFEGQLAGVLRAARLRPENSEYLFRAQALARRSGDFQWALRYGLDYQHLMSRRHGEQGRDFARAANELALTLHQLARHDDAEPLFRRALAIRQQVLGEEHIRTATSYNNLGYSLNAQGRYDDAETFHRKALAIRERVLGQNHLHTATSYNNLGYSLNAQGRYDDAETFHRKALAIRERVLGEDHLQTARSRGSLGLILHFQGRYGEADTLLRNSLQIRERIQGEDHYDTATAYVFLGVNLNAQGRYDEAETFLRKALEIRRRVLGEDHPRTATNYSAVGMLLHDRGHYDEAGIFYRKGLEIRERIFGEENPATAFGYNNVGKNLTAQGQYREAEDLLRKALDIRKRVLDEDNPRMADSYNDLGLNLNGQERLKDAEAFYRKALSIRETVLGEDHRETAETWNNLGINLNAQGRYDEAETYLRKAAVTSEKSLGKSHPKTQKAAGDLEKFLSEKAARGG